MVKLDYAEQYEGGIWDRAMVMAYAKDESLTLGELKRIGVWLQLDEVVYAIEETPDLDQWMTAWRPYLEELSDKRNIYVRSKENRQFLKTLESIESLEETYMVVLLQLAALKRENLTKRVEAAHKEILPPEYLKTLMARKNQVTIELKKRLEQDRTLAEELLNPVTLYPHFVMAGARSDVTDLSQSTLSLGQSGLMDSIVFDASGVSQILEESDRAGSSSDVPSNSLTYQMQMDPSNTYVLDPSSSKYVVATTEPNCPTCFSR